MQSFFYENSFDRREHEPEGEAKFYMNGLAQRLVFTQRQKGTHKWPVNPVIGDDIKKTEIFTGNPIYTIYYNSRK